MTGGRARDRGPMVENHSGELLAFRCPRCGADVRERYHGPCGSCRDELRRSVAGEAREVEAAAYEPKANVTPNAVALREE